MHTFDLVIKMFLWLFNEQIYFHTYAKVFKVIYKLILPAKKLSRANFLAGSEVNINAIRILYLLQLTRLVLARDYIVNFAAN